MRHLLGGGCPPETGPKALDGDGEAILKLPEALSIARRRGCGSSVDNSHDGLFGRHGPPRSIAGHSGVSGGKSPCFADPSCLAILLTHKDITRVLFLVYRLASGVIGRMDQGMQHRYWPAAERPEYHAMTVENEPNAM
ncbi:MAG: hypothetical protein ACLQNE_09705 [Thermoguttaceae bacterium]